MICVVGTTSGRCLLVEDFGNAACLAVQGRSGAMPRPPEDEDLSGVAKKSVPQQVPVAQGGGMIEAMLGIAGDDIGRTACRLNEKVSGAMPRPPEEDENGGDSETLVEVGGE